MSTEYLPHQVRVIEEKAELDGKISRLKAFLGSNTAGTLTVNETNLLYLQKLVMEEYSEILRLRIEAFSLPR